MTERSKRLTLGAVVVLVAIVAFVTPRVPQDPSYHLFADRRALLGVPNGLDVLSNIPFAIVGVIGLLIIRRDGRLFHDRWERWPSLTLFAGTALTAFGSAYYHLEPNNARLVWDRLPMTIGFMGLLCALIAERVSVTLARKLLVPLLLLGGASVVYWYWSELRGEGDLRAYGVVQFGSLLAVVVLLALYPSRYPGGGYLVTGLVLYGLAKVFEFGDAAIFAALRVIGGHAVKHLSAAAGVGCVVMMLRKRRPRPLCGRIDRHALA